MHKLRDALAFLLPCGTIAFAADLFRRVGWVFYPEQFFAVMLGLAMALVFLHVPAGKGRERTGPIPWYDKIAALISIVCGVHIANRYPVLAEMMADLPAEGLITAIFVVPLILEGLRRTTGYTLMLVALAAIVLALVAGSLPEPLTGRSMSPARLVFFLTWDTSALLGTPLRIISTVVVSFILFGQSLFLSGGSAFFTDSSMVLMGRFRGGPAKIAIVASSLFGTISGSVVANVVSTGVVTIPLMKQAGYRPHIAGAIEAVASTGGQLMPPVMGIAAFIMAEYLEISYALVALAALIPSVLYYVALFAQADLEAARNGIDRVPEELIPSGRKVLKDGWFFPIPFGALILAIFWLNYPLEESAMLATVLVVVAAVFLGYKGQRIGLKEIVEIIRSTGYSVLEIFMIGSAAGMVIGILNISGLGFALTMSLVTLAGGSVLALLGLSAIVSIILGMGMPTVGVYILLATLVAPALVQMGIQPMAAHMFILYYGMLSFITPPVAVGAFAAASIAGADALRTGFAAMRFGWVAFIIPFMFVFSGTLLMNGDWLHIAVDFVAAVAGVWLVSAAMIGFGVVRLGTFKRILYPIAGLCLVLPMGAFGHGRLVNAVGAVLGIGLLLVDIIGRRRTRQTTAAEI